MDRVAKLTANIWKLQVWEVLRWFLVMMPIMIPFLLDKGLTLPEIYSLQAAFAILIVVLEVPSGYFADVVGRKQSMVVGSFFITIGPILYALGSTFWMFFVAEMLWGVGVAFYSGAKEAMLYDTLAELKREKEYVKVSGQMRGLGNWSEGVAALLAAALVLISFTAPFWATAIVYFVSLLITLSLVEPHRKKLVKNNLKQLWHVFLDTVHRNRALKWMVAFSVVTGIGTRIAAWTYQPLFIEAGIPVSLFGVIWAGTLFLVGIGSWFAHHVDGKVGRHRALVAVLVIAVVAYLAVWVLPLLVGIIAIMLIQVSRGLNGPLTDDEINALTASDRRATVFSIRSFVHQLVYAPLILGVGFIAQSSVQNVFGLLAIGIGVLGTLTLTFAFIFHRSRSRESFIKN